MTRQFPLVAALLLTLPTLSGFAPFVAAAPSEGGNDTRTEVTYLAGAPVSLVAVQAPLGGGTVAVGGVRVPVQPGQDTVTVNVVDLAGWSVTFQLYVLDGQGQGMGTSAHCRSHEGALPNGAAAVWVVPTVANLACPISTGGPATTGTVVVSLHDRR